MKQFKVISTVDKSEYVDWYQAENQDFALALAKADAKENGLPERTTFKVIEVQPDTIKWSEVL